MTCLRCNRDVDTLDGHCRPCRRHLGMEPRKMPRPTRKPNAPRTKGNGRTHGSSANPSRRQVREAYAREKALLKAHRVGIRLKTSDILSVRGGERDA